MFQGHFVGFDKVVLASFSRQSKPVSRSSCLKKVACRVTRTVGIVSHAFCYFCMHFFFF
uniref:Uncharacterized protein n=1 Tax=Anguilla anguilla TaxID=7936 RepID=A0A0E9W7F4_ANGAN